MAGLQGEHAPDGNTELQQLLARVEALEAAVAALKAGEQPSRKAAAPPPVASSAHGPAHNQASNPPLEEPVAAKISLEDRLGSQVFNLIGIVALVLGASWFFKLAVEHGWIGPVARVLLGLAVGAGAVVWSESFRRKGMLAFSYSLRAVGSATLYLVLWAAFQLYHLVPAGAALAAMALVTAWNGWMAWSQDAELVAAYALAGGFATPLLLSTGGDHEAFLFTYLAALNAATVLLVRARGWQRLLLPALVATAAYFAGWYLRFFAGLVEGTWNIRAGETIAFACIFWALFVLASLRGHTGEGSYRSVPVPLANAACFALALSGVLDRVGAHAWLAWVMLALGAIYLGLLRLQSTSLARALHLAIAVVLLSVAIPLKASGHSLTTAWLVEGLVLFWAATRVTDDAARSRPTLRAMSGGAFALGLAALTIGFVPGVETQFFSANLGAAAVALATLGATLWLSLKDKQVHTRGIPASLACLLGLDYVGMVLVARDRPALRGSVAFWNAGFASALVGAAVLGTATWIGYRERRRSTNYLQLAAISLVLFNLVVLLACVQQIDDLFRMPTAAVTGDPLARSLAISGFLMAYGALLLAAGFWRRIAFVRWQALVLLLFTVLKVFLYDMRSLSQGYRVASFLALGAVLMGVSYVYQKDWLGLKQPAAERAL